MVNPFQFKDDVDFLALATVQPEPLLESEDATDQTYYHRQEMTWAYVFEVGEGDARRRVAASSDGYALHVVCNPKTYTTLPDGTQAIQLPHSWPWDEGMIYRREQIRERVEMYLNWHDDAHQVVTLKMKAEALDTVLEKIDGQYCILDVRNNRPHFYAGGTTYIPDGWTVTGSGITGFTSSFLRRLRAAYYFQPVIQLSFVPAVDLAHEKGAAILVGNRDSRYALIAPVYLLMLAEDVKKLRSVVPE
jgi:hypothetical protein